MTNRNGYLAATVLIGVSVAVAVPGGAAWAAASTAGTSFVTVGEHPFAVPPGVTTIHVVAVGGRGAGVYVPGGRGARAEADVRVTPGTTIYAEVGGNGSPATTAQQQPAPGGWNGGRPGGAWWGGALAAGLGGTTPTSGGGGGGASDIQTCPVDSCQPIDVGSPALLLTAAGGGGAGGQSIGGSGGTPAGGDASAAADVIGTFDSGIGATVSAPGYNGNWLANNGPSAHCTGDAGDSFGGGGGGGGYYCGGGGGSLLLSGGGGGGSSRGPAGTVYTLSDQPPSVTITYPTAVRLAPASRSSLTLGTVNGQVVQQTPDGSRSQLWQLVAQGALYQIVNQATGTCMTTDGVAGHPLTTGPCQPAGQDLWQLPSNFGGPPTGSLIRNPASDLYAEVLGGSTAPGGVIDAWPFNGGYANQYFLTFPG